jgi:hypothetical protein
MAAAPASTLQAQGARDQSRLHCPRPAFALVINLCCPHMQTMAHMPSVGEISLRAQRVPRAWETEQEPLVERTCVISSFVAVRGCRRAALGDFDFMLAF